MARKNGRLLQTQLFMHINLSVEGMSQELLDTVLYEQNNSGTPIRKWKNGKRSISERNARRVLEITGSEQARHIYDYLLFEALNDSEMSEDIIRSLLKPYLETIPTYSKELVWKPISDSFEFCQSKIPDIFRTFSNYQYLVKERNTHSFFCILMLMRLAEAQRNNSDHIMHATNAYRIFPFMAQNPLLQEFLPQIKAYMDIVVNRVDITARSLKVDWKIINAQSADQDFLSSYSPLTYDIAAKATKEDPFILMY